MIVLHWELVFGNLIGACGIADAHEAYPEDDEFEEREKREHKWVLQSIHVLGDDVVAILEDADVRKAPVDVG